MGIYDLTDIANPVESGRSSVKGWAWSLFRQDSLLYVGAKTGGLQILDVSNAAAPRTLSTFKGLKYPKSVQVENGIAYVAEGPAGMAIVDVRSATTPKLLSVYKTDGWANQAFKSGNTALTANDRKKRL